MAPSFPITRKVTRAKEVVYKCGDIDGVLSTPSAQRKLLLVVQPGYSKRNLDAMVSKAKARDGVAGYELYEQHTFNIREDGVVQIRRRQEEVAA